MDTLDAPYMSKESSGGEDAFAAVVRKRKWVFWPRKLSAASQKAETLLGTKRNNAPRCQFRDITGAKQPLAARGHERSRKPSFLDDPDF